MQSARPYWLFPVYGAIRLFCGTKRRSLAVVLRRGGPLWLDRCAIAGEVRFYGAAKSFVKDQLGREVSAAPPAYRN